MMSRLIGQKIQKLRRQLGDTQAEFADRLGVEQPTVSRWERGEMPKRALQAPIASLAAMSVAEFFHSEDGPRLIPIVGYVAGGESFTPFDDEEASGIDHITLSLGEDEQIAVRVRGNSMFPVYRDGDTIIGRRQGRRDASRFVGHDCIVKTVLGEGYVKRVLMGTRSGFFRLRSYNPAFDDIEDVEIAWAAPIVWIGRGG